MTAKDKYDYIRRIIHALDFLFVFVIVYSLFVNYRLVTTLCIAICLALVNYSWQSKFDAKPFLFARIAHPLLLAAAVIMYFI